MAYNCGRCGCEFGQKGHIRDHFLRKNRCKPLVEDLGVEDLLKSIEHPDTEYTHSCADCGKQYRSRQGLLKHKKSAHNYVVQHQQPQQQQQQQGAITTDLLQQIVQQVMQAMQATQANTTTNNNNTTNTTNNNNTINIYNLPPPVNRCNFGDESLEHITHDMLTEYTLGMDQGNVKLFSKIHFDPDVPQNHNIAHKSLKNKQCFVVENGQWTIVPYKTAMQQAIRKVSGMRYNHCIHNATDPAIEKNVELIMGHHNDVMEPKSKAHQKLSNDLACKVQTMADPINQPMLVAGL